MIVIILVIIAILVLPRDDADLSVTDKFFQIPHAYNEHEQGHISL